MFDSFYNNYKWSYNEAFAWEFAGTALVYGGIALVSTLILYLISVLIKRSDERAPDSYQAINENSGIEGGIAREEVHHNQQEEEGQRAGSSKNKAIAAKVFSILALLASWWALLSIAIAPSVLSALGIIPIWSSMIITLLIFGVKFMAMIFYYSPNFLNKMPKQNPSYCSRICRRVGITLSMNRLPFGIFISFAFLYSIVVPLITAETCMDFFNYGYGSTFEDFGISTKFSRYFQIDTACPQGTMCQFYATLPEDSSTSVIMNVHTGVDISSITIGYDELSKLDQTKINEGIHQPLAFNATGKSFYIDLESRGARYVNSVYITGLKPNTAYYLEVYFNNKTQSNTTYLTLPTNKLERNLLIAAGGDAGTSLNTRQMTAALGNFNLDAILIGGDLAYDNGIRACYYSFDLFLNMFKPVNQKIGRMIPFFSSVGNHDVGFNAFQDTIIDITQNLYYIYFPLHSKVDGSGNLLYQIPDLAERVPYNYHLLGNTVQLCLDSGYVFPYQGVQVDFINNVSTKFSNYVKMANFHVPMYPTCFNPLYDDPRTLSEPREHWAPLFEKYKFASVFENHVHLYKATFPLKEGDREDSGDGVMYFGDGNWGINPDGCYPDFANGNVTGVLDTYNDITHVWLINITNQTLSHYAVNMTGQMFDKEFNLTVSKYINVNDEL